MVIELTEHERIDSYAALEPALDRLRAAGALLAIDDAGAGYAGLQHVLSLRPDIIKLDRALVEGLDRDEAKRTLVEMIGTLAGRLDAWLLAEGIETGEELDVLDRARVSRSRRATSWLARGRRSRSSTATPPPGS